MTARRFAVGALLFVALCLGAAAWLWAIPGDPAGDPSVPRSGKRVGKTKVKAGKRAALSEPEEEPAAGPDAPLDLPPLDLSGRPAAPPGALHVVVVLACTLRRDQLTPYGGPANTTPFLAELARDGVRFDDLISASAWTKESSTALFTGFHALGVGMTDRRRILSTRVLSERVDTLEERFTRAGWVAYGVTANPHLNRVYGMAQGFDRYHDTATRGFAKRNKLDGSDVVEVALAMLDARGPDERGRPVYVRVVFIDPHYPIEARAEEVEPFRDAPNERVARYRVGVRRGDDALRALDAGLRERGFTEENTLLVVITDHGEGLSTPPHHRGQHGRVLYQTLTVVPWVMRGPGVARGQVIGGLASHLDFAPTLLGLAGLPAEGLPGDDLSALVRGRGSATSRTRAFADTWYEGANRSAVFTATHTCQRDWGSRGLRNDTFVDGCFDRRADPDFTRTVEVPGLPDELVRWREERQAEYDAWPDVADAPDDAEVAEQLRALGYGE